MKTNILQSNVLTSRFLVIALSAFFLFGCGSKDSKKSAVDMKVKGEEVATLTAPPNVPPPIDRSSATKLIVNLEVIEEIGTMVDGTDYTYWTYGGSVPGSFIRIREGDEVEFHLKNHPSSKVPHNIDLHAVTGDGGGAASSFTAPGHESVFSFKALNPGLYVYHCATAPVGMHIANGMYGLILVEPAGGLPPVDKEYYIMQGDFYTKGAYGEPGLQPFDMEKALMEIPDYVVFNGSVGALTGDNAITANVGETVRLYVGNGGPNLVSSFHVIGEIFDLVYTEGGFNVNTNVQTTLVPAGGSAIVEFKVDVPGTFILVDHAIFRAFNKGAIGMLKVEGEENKSIYSGKQNDLVYLGEGGGIQEMPESGDAPEVAELTMEKKMEFGESLYKQNCAACHMPDGAGIKGSFPPLAKSDYFANNPGKAISPIVNGLDGKITVNGESYENIMPKVNMTDEQAASVVTYIMNSWGNTGGEVSTSQVKAERK